MAWPRHQRTAWPERRSRAAVGIPVRVAGSCPPAGDRGWSRAAMVHIRAAEVRIRAAEVRIRRPQAARVGLRRWEVCSWEVAGCQVSEVGSRRPVGRAARVGDIRRAGAGPKAGTLRRGAGTQKPPVERGYGDVPRSSRQQPVEGTVASPARHLKWTRFDQPVPFARDCSLSGAIVVRRLILHHLNGCVSPRQTAAGCRERRRR